MNLIYSKNGYESNDGFIAVLLQFTGWNEDKSLLILHIKGLSQDQLSQRWKFRSMIKIMNTSFIDIPPKDGHRS